MRRRPRLLPDWRDILRRAWSIRLMLLARAPAESHPRKEQQHDAPSSAHHEPNQIR